MPFALLAPTSSFVPLVNEVGAERRMYLPLAALIGLTCYALYNLCAHRREYLRIAMGSALCAALALGVATAERNRTFESTVSIWSSAVAAVPDNPRAHVNLALELAAAGDLDKAQLHYLQTLELAPRHAVAHNNLALVLDKLGDRDRAIAHYQQAIELRTGFFEAHNNLASLCCR